MLEQSPFGIQTFAPDDSRIETNSGWEEIWGVTRDQVSGYNVLRDALLERDGLLPVVSRAFSGELVSLPAMLSIRRLPAFPADRGGWRWCSIPFAISEAISAKSFKCHRRDRPAPSGGTVADSDRELPLGGMRQGHGGAVLFVNEHMEMLLNHPRHEVIGHREAESLPV